MNSHSCSADFLRILWNILAGKSTRDREELEEAREEDAADMWL